MSIPAYLDMARLCQELSQSERTIEAWVEQGIIPPPRKPGGKRLWKWKEVEAALDRRKPIEAPLTERIRDATRAAFAPQNPSPNVRNGDPRLPRERQVREPRTDDAGKLPADPVSD